MAKSTFLQLCQIARRECGITGGGPPSVLNQAGILAKVVAWVADADQELQGRWHDWDFMHHTGWSENTIINTAAMAAPADLGTWDVDSFYLNYSATTHKQLLIMDYKRWRSDYRQGVKTSKRPNSIVIKPDRSLIMEPPPDAIYSLSADYWKRPVKMTANTDVSPIPEEYERIIIARAKIFYAESQGVGEILASAQIEYDDLLDKMEAKYLPNQSGRRMGDPGLMVVRPE